MRFSLLRFNYSLIVALLFLISFATPNVVQAQGGNKKITGIVLDETNTPIVGVTVLAVGTKLGTATDIDGNYSISVPADTKTLTFSYIGYENVTKSINAGNVINVSMQPQSQTMNELVVIGYGTQKKNDLTGSISTIGEKDFNDGLISSAEQLVNGKVAGVQITTSGSPTSGSTIRIRGGASLNASNDPLIVLDGVPMEVGGSISGSGNFLSLINPNDIESMTILKDASSTAIYGSRASNGVIIITTKKGKGDKIKVDFSTTNSVQTRTNSADMLSRDQFYDVITKNGTKEQQALLGTATTDWNDQIFHSAYGTDNNLSVSGRLVENFPFRVSLGFYDQDGILRTDNTKRYTGNISLNPSFLQDYLKFNFNVKGAVSDNRFAETSAIWNASTANPTIPVYSGKDIYGGYTEAIDANNVPVNGANANPVGLLNQYSSTSKVYRVIGNADVDYRMQFFPDLRAHVTLGYDYSKGSGSIYVSDEAFQYRVSGGRDYSYGPQKNYNKLFTAYLNYNKELPSIKSSLDVTGGYDYQYWKYTTAAYDQKNIKGEISSSSAAADQRHTLLSYYGRVNYTFDSRYLLTATIRRDGSSRFKTGNKWGSFPSLALAWRVSNEPFFNINDIMNDLKVRLSYGVTGQQDGIGNYGYIPMYTISQTGAEYMFGGTPIYTYRPEAYNDNLKWESTKSYNAGFDFGFLNNRISGSLDYYNRRTKDLLATVPSPAGTNFDKSILTNVGEMKSSGVEISVNATPIQTRDFTWSVSANATWQKNKITNLTLVDGIASPNTPVGPTVDRSYNVQVFTEGYAPYSFYVYKQIYDEATKMPIEGLYADLNGDGKVDSDDLYRYHSPAPDWIFGFSTSLNYKKWTLSTSLRANVGNYVYNGMAMNTGAWSTVSYNSYQLNNLSTSYLNTRFNNRQHLSDYYVENASFVKMDNLQLSYDFGKIAKWCSLNASVMMQNVFTITKYKGVDPEVSNGVDMSVYPRPRVYSLTLGFKF